MDEKKEEGPVLSPLPWPLRLPALAATVLLMADAPGLLTAGQPLSACFTERVNFLHSRSLGQGHEAGDWQARVQALKCTPFCFSGNCFQVPCGRGAHPPSLPPW